MGERFLVTVLNPSVTTDFLTDGMLTDPPLEKKPHYNIITPYYTHHIGRRVRRIHGIMASPPERVRRHPYHFA
jgi:hypothetical protein